MTTPRFIQVHTLHSWPAALLNRDDAGLAKRLPFGGAIRTRISSQCLKRHWRMAADEFALANIGVPMGTRSKLIVERAILRPLLANGVEPAMAEAIKSAFLRGNVDGDEAEDAKNRQALLLGQPEVDWLRQQAETICLAANDANDAKNRAEAFFKGNDMRANFKELRHHAGLESRSSAAW